MKLLTRNCSLAILLASALPVYAQSAGRLRVDNDAFNFWQQPYDRSDDEYTSGVQLSGEYTGPAFFTQRWPSVKWLATPSARTSHNWTAGQSIYTAPRGTGQSLPLPGTRPDAGLLWLRETQRTLGDSSYDDVGFTVGISGPLSLAEPSQKFFHGLAPSFNRDIDWTHQLPFEPLVAASWDRHAVRKMTYATVDRFFGATLGNLLTEIRGGANAHRDFAIEKQDAPTDWRFALDTDVALRGVIWNAMLNGTMFRHSQRVTLRRVVPEIGFSGEALFRHAGLTYGIHRTGAEYTTQRGAHVYSTIAVTVR